jgi:SNF2 family DNA or RNA helicase
MDEALRAAVEKLRDIRTRENLSIKPSRHLRTSFVAPDGTERPLKVRNYQVQMILHLLSMARFIVGDDTGLGKTLSSIAACCYLWDREPDTAVVVLTKKSVVNQWADEVRRFTTGVEAFTAKGTPAQRRKAY